MIKVGDVLEIVESQGAKYTGVVYYYGKPDLYIDSFGVLLSIYGNPIYFYIERTGTMMLGIYYNNISTTTLSWKIL